MLRRLDGSYTFESEGDGTKVHYELIVDLSAPLPGAHQAPGRRDDHGHRAPRAEEGDRAAGAADVDLGSSSSPARAASARRPWPRRPRCEPPSRACAPWCAPPIRPTRSPTRSGCRSATTSATVAPGLARHPARRPGPPRGVVGRRPRVPRRAVRLGGRGTGRSRGARGHPRARRGVRARRHQDLRDQRRRTTSSSSTARRRPRRSGCSRCPTSSAGTWTGSSPPSAASPGRCARSSPG